MSAAHRRNALPALLLACLASVILLASCRGRVAPPPGATAPPKATEPAPAAPRRPTEPERMAPSARRPSDLAERVFPGPERPGEGPAVIRPTGALSSFLVYGDSRSNPAAHRRVVGAMARTPGISFVCHTGDLVGDGADVHEWETFLGAVAPILARVPLYPALGNHDLPRASALRAFAQMRGLPTTLPGDGYYYGVEFGGVALAMLDSESLIRGDPAQLAWLRSYLGRSRAAARILVLHRPLWSPGPNGGSGSIRRQLLPIIGALGVRLVFAGHDHFYYRTQRDGLTEVITAGGGAPFYEVKSPGEVRPADVLRLDTYHFVRVDVGSAALTVRALDLEGRLLDEFSLPLR